VVSRGLVSMSHHPLGAERRPRSQSLAS
jgi:hypothetical protein